MLELQARFRSPLWATVDELASYLQEAFEQVKIMRKAVPGEMHAVANQDMSTYTSVLVIFTAACAFMCGRLFFIGPASVRLNRDF